jgi:hypothetical protein
VPCWWPDDRHTLGLSFRYCFEQKISWPNFN